MNTNLRGLQLFRQLCRQGDLALAASTAPVRSDPVSYWMALRRSLSAQPATNLTSHNPHVNEQQSLREEQAVAHEALLQAFQKAINKGRNNSYVNGDVRNKTQRDLRRRRILQDFAPMKVLLHQYGEDNEVYKQVAAKWEQQIEGEWAALDKLRQQYEAESAQLKKVGKGSLNQSSTTVMQSWYEPLVKAIEQEHKAVMAGEKGKDRAAYGPFLYELRAQSLAVLTMHGVLGTLLSEDEAGKTKLTRVAMAVGKLVNEQVGAENMKRRIENEHKRQRRLVQTQKKMWDSFAECQRNGYDWEARRATFESQLNEIQAQKYIVPPRPDEHDENAQPDELSGLVPGLEREVPEAGVLARVQAKAAELSSNSLLADAAREGVDYRQGLNSLPEASGTQTAASDWFKVDPGHETRMKEIKKRWKKLGEKAGSLSEKDKRYTLGQENWEPRTLAKVGVILTKLLMDVAKIKIEEVGPTGRPVLGPDGQPNKIMVSAFSHSIQNTYDDKGKAWWKKFGMITMHDKLMQQLSDKEIAGAQIPRWIPMVIPPREWAAPNNGGYLCSQPLVMRVRGGSKQTDTLFEHHAAGRLQSVYDALNAMGSTAWSINATILENVEYAYKELQGGFVGLPLHGSMDVHPVPPPLSKLFRTEAEKGQLKAYFMKPPKREMLSWKAQVNKAKKKNREMHSLRCDLGYKLEVAHDYAKEEAFYYPHNLDFRGRAYPMHPSLNHLGADMSRGLLQFSEAKPLGPHGLRWLEISVANLYGKGADKLSFDGRVQFARDHMHDIFDSAENPFGGGKNAKWWQQADSPWQLLAVCYDLQAALSSGDPESYCSKLPVHQDGSCNGLQHYAALGRDEKGGRAVNLLPVDKPQDVYSEIAALVKAQVDKDAARGVPEALVLQDNVDRKLVKQTVMTSVYGVTFVGARQQISSRLAERGWDDERLLYKTSSYGARVTLNSLHQMFDSAKDIMQWLSLCARAVAIADKAVNWTSPLGLPVVQPYRKKSKSHVQTLLQRVILVHQTEDSPIQRVRQRTAFPPNYIHCLDSSHMMLTAIDCHKAGLSFAGVHDSFWTHAGSVNDMNRILREKFYELHSQPLLSKLRDELMEQYSPEVNIPEVPQLGKLDLSKITEADYFFN